MGERDPRPGCLHPFSSNCRAWWPGCLWFWLCQSHNVLDTRPQIISGITWPHPPLPCHLTGKTKDPTVWAIVLLLRHLMGSPIVWGYTWKPFPKDKKRIMKLQEGWHMLVILVLGEVEIRDQELQASFGYRMSSGTALCCIRWSKPRVWGRASLE